mmetsp:Transcript_38345/g.76032  ORF Transcript_38345/g.76032 Transcript_38345/m.76032 type:complete len:87 (-) Transcript_38345:162-422(-)
MWMSLVHYRCRCYGATPGRMGPLYHARVSRRIDVPLSRLCQRIAKVGAALDCQLLVMVSESILQKLEDIVLAGAMCVAHWVTILFP